MNYKIKYLEYLSEETTINGNTPQRAHKNALERVKCDIRMDKEKEMRDKYRLNLDIKCSECGDE